VSFLEPFQPNCQFHLSAVKLKSASYSRWKKKQKNDFLVQKTNFLVQMHTSAEKNSGGGESAKIKTGAQLNCEFHISAVKLKSASYSRWSTVENQFFGSNQAFLCKMHNF